MDGISAYLGHIFPRLPTPFAHSDGVVIRTNSYDTNLTINAASDTVRHYGDIGSLNIIAVKGESYHEFGKAAFAEIKTGRIVLESESKLDHIHLTKTNENFVDITIAKANDVEMPALSRDPVEIPTAGKLIVALQNGTNKEDAKDYVWLTAVGIYEQVTVSSSKTDAGTNYAATSTSVADEKKEAASQIANNITASVLGYDYTVRAEKVGDDWVYTLEGQSEEETAVVAFYEVSVATETSEVTVMNGLTPVPTTTTVDNGIDEDEKESVKNKTINDEKGVASFTASIQDIVSGYYMMLAGGEYVKFGTSQSINFKELVDNVLCYELDFDEDFIADEITVSWTSEDSGIADVTVNTVYWDFTGYPVDEEELNDPDFDPDDYTASYDIKINGKTPGQTNITITYSDSDGNEFVEVRNIIVYETEVKIGETTYNTLEEAVAAAQNGDTIKLFKNIGSRSLDISTGYLPGVTYGHDLSYTTNSRETQLTGVKDLVLDLNGYQINTESLRVSNTNLEIIDSSEGKTGVINSLVTVEFAGNTASFEWDSNYGVYYETATTYDDPTVVTFTGGTIKQVTIADNTKVVVNGSRIVNNEVYEGNFIGSGYGVGSNNNLSNAQIEVRSGVVCGTETNIKAEGAGNTITITGGAFKFNPSANVDLEHYDVTPNDDASLWIVTAK